MLSHVGFGLEAFDTTTVTTTVGLSPEPENAGSSGGIGIWLVIAAVAVVVLVKWFWGRPKFRQPRYLDDSPPHAVRVVQGVWDQAIALQRGLDSNRKAAKTVEDSLRHLRTQLGDGPLAQELRQIEYGVAQLGANIGHFADSAGRIAKGLSADN